VRWRGRTRALRIEAATGESGDYAATSREEMGRQVEEGLTLTSEPESSPARTMQFCFNPHDGAEPGKDKGRWLKR
jgi:hypothetical protein